MREYVESISTQSKNWAWYLKKEREVIELYVEAERKDQATPEFVPFRIRL